MADGWVRLYRQSVERGWLKNHKLWAFWTWCLLKSTHQEYTETVGFQRVLLHPGEFIFGRDAAAKELGMSVQSIRTCVDILRKRQNLTIKSTNKFSIVSIRNWNSYQNENGASNQQINQQVTSK